MENARKGITVNATSLPATSTRKWCSAVPAKVLKESIAAIFGSVGRLGKAEEIAKCVSLSSRAMTRGSSPARQ